MGGARFGRSGEVGQQKAAGFAAASPLKIVPIPHLIALKLQAGGHKSKADIIELPVRNPDLELDEVRSVCARYGLGGLEELITESRFV
jgi:hypothetical protein